MTQPEILREVGYDQTDVPSEQANQAPDVDPLALPDEESKEPEKP